jgi:hypothetical protein
MTLWLNSTDEKIELKAILCTCCMSSKIYFFFLHALCLSSSFNCLWIAFCKNDLEVPKPVERGENLIQKSFTLTQLFPTVDMRTKSLSIQFSRHKSQKPQSQRHKSPPHERTHSNPNRWISKIRSHSTAGVDGVHFLPGYLITSSFSHLLKDSLRNCWQQVSAWRAEMNKPGGDTSNFDLIPF